MRGRTRMPRPAADEWGGTALFGPNWRRVGWLELRGPPAEPHCFALGRWTLENDVTVDAADRAHQRGVYGRRFAAILRWPATVLVLDFFF